LLSHEMKISEIISFVWKSIFPRLVSSLSGKFYCNIVELSREKKNKKRRKCSRKEGSNEDKRTTTLIHCT
ncbi:hypothetical protein T4B_621, partial [Trichinella pseudospiralis]